ncbi:flavin reductase family protein [Actinomadura graeca]|uniref:Flavin reductase family protein n=1 Tax=Actinomadura graeca TaxID=2750812 RepID=A0ABX8QYE8_9ACTN|nr:flavin reductase family protein [Actinomadura graeca]QXJ23875.1 flavin reductase family protein [Actinomadura graeca]
MAAKGIEPLNGRRPAGAPPDPVAFRGVLGRFATGVAAVTGLDDGVPVGLVVNSFTSVSLTPPLVSFCVAHTSLSWPRVRRGARHCVSFLAEHQREHARRLAGAGGAKFGGLPWSPSPAGLPLLDGALGWLECTVDAEHVAGDHVIVVARVHHVGAHDVSGPLIYYRGRYGRFAAPAAGRDTPL